MLTSVGNSTGQSILTALNAGGGIDVSNLATSLVNAEKLPQQNIIDAAKAAATTTISSVGKVKSALLSLQTALAGLGNVTSFQTSPVSSDSSKVTVAFNPTATPPSFNNFVSVQQLATPTQVLLPPVTSQDGSLLGTVGTSRRLSLVSGSVQNSVVNGIAMSLPASAITGSLSVNGVTTGNFSLSNGSLSDNRKAVVAAINALSAQTGVSAVDTGDDTNGVTLTAGDGRAINVSLNSSGASDLTAQMTGVNMGQYVTSTSGNSISGSSMSAPSMISPATSVSGSLVLNNTSISVTLTSDIAANRAAIVAAINAQTKITGVTAVDSGSDTGGISLTSASTQSINLSFPPITGASGNSSINPLTSSTTGLSEGRVNAVTKLVGGAMTAPAGQTAGTININGIDIDVSLGTDAGANRSNMIAAINAQTNNTGVTATANSTDSGITLTAIDGRAIKTNLGGTLTEAQTGLKKNVLLSVDMTSTSNDTLLTLRDKINAVSGMTASIVQGGTDTNPLYYLSVKSGTGVVNNFYVDVTAMGSTVPLDASDTSNSVPATDGLLGNYYSNVTLGQDAMINVDGAPITSSSNSFDKAVPNVTITAVGLTNGSPVKISSQTNTSALSNAINSLVTGYNQVISTMSSEMAYNMADHSKNGGLANNATARNLISQLRTFTTQSVTGYDGQAHTLADIGVKTNMDGTLSLDNAVFNSVLENNPDLVSAVLASKKSISDSRLALGSISSSANTGAYTIKKQIMPPSVTNLPVTNTSNPAASVQFYSLKSGSFVTVGGLTFTANTDMSAEEVAAAFSSLSADASTGQSSTKGTYSGSLSGWTSGAMNGSQVIFTAASSGTGSALSASGHSLGWTINGDTATLSGNTLSASPTSSAAGISILIPPDLAANAADGFTATLNYSQGIVERFTNMINDATGNSSALQSLSDDQNKVLANLNDKQTTLDNRMSALLMRYQQQFNSVTILLNQAKSTMSSLTDFQTAWSNSLKGY